MIKFFRKVRLELFAENKSMGKYSKYMLYAIGEIVLVVIGILIALQFNNYNERIGIHKKQENHLLLIKGEMMNNLEEIASEKEDLLRIINSNRDLITLMDSDEAIASISEDDLSLLLLLPMSRKIEVEYENGAFTELIASGGLKDIKNDSIRGILASWEGKLTGVRSQEKALHESLNKTINHIEAFGHYRVVFDEIGLSEEFQIENAVKKASNKALLKSPKFENILLNYLAAGFYLHERTYPSLENDIKELIHLIDKELN